MITKLKLFALDSETSRYNLLITRTFDEELVFFREIFQHQNFRKHIQDFVTVDVARTKYLV